MSERTIVEVIPGYTLAADAARYLGLKDPSVIRRLVMDSRLEWKWLVEPTDPTKPGKMRAIEVQSLLNYEKERDAFKDKRAAQRASKRSKKKE